MNKIHITYLATALCAGLSSYATAQDNSSPILGLDSVQIIKGWRQADGTHMAAAHIKLEKGWKTYWRVAGGGGIPPVFDWTGSKNIKSVSFQWPAPSIFVDYGVRTIGFKDELVLPFVLTPETQNTTMKMQASINFGVCDDVCVPVQVDVQADLPRRAAVGKTTINYALSKGAKTGASAGIKSASCTFNPISDGMEINVSVQRAAGFDKKTVLVVEYPTEDWMSQGKTTVKNTTAHSTATLYGKITSLIDRSKLRLTVLTDGSALEIMGCKAPV